MIFSFSSCELTSFSSTQGLNTNFDSLDANFKKRIFSYLSREDLLSCTQVSKTWRHLIISNTSCFPAINTHRIPINNNLQKNEFQTAVFFKNTVASEPELTNKIIKFCEQVTIGNNGQFKCSFPYTKNYELKITIHNKPTKSISSLEEIMRSSHEIVDVKEVCVFNNLKPVVKELDQKLKCSTIAVYERHFLSEISFKNPKDSNRYVKCQWNSDLEDQGKIFQHQEMKTLLKEHSRIEDQKDKCIIV